jgi:hypothetical protein
MVGWLRARGATDGVGERHLSLRRWPISVGGEERSFRLARRPAWARRLKGMLLSRLVAMVPHPVNCSSKPDELEASQQAE